MSFSFSQLKTIRFRYRIFDSNVSYLSFMNPNRLHLLPAQSIAQTYIAHLRNIDTQTDRVHFRRNTYRLGQILAYELSKSFSYTVTEIQTPLAKTTSQCIDGDIVLISILRAGLHLHEAILSVFDQADNGFVAAYRKHDAAGNFHIHSEYTTCPDLNDKYLIVADPMLASGSSALLALEQLAKFGTARDIHFVCLIAAQAGVDRLLSEHPSVHIWTAAIDPELNDKSYIVPGLGDAGDLMYGPKLQS